MAAHTESPPSKQLLRCVKQLELRMTFRRNSKVCNLGTLLCSLCFHTANGCSHARRSSEFTFTPRSLPEPNFFRLQKEIYVDIIFFQKSCFRSVKHSPSYTKIRCRAKLFLHRSLPGPKVKLFHWHDIESKLI
ncbi:hypothetical protein AVEN_131621-1 [Araneus ventricosus]|uniref:Uncharacterized protein n=1 Tax=Araneus ventricosus TaxID=182803 RepID=A0A4Y2ESR9_ARAVE|nr:hypothetical protein AVEN_131621-1 [Araneus ventricosus]